ncbi:YchJ family metal-binding protein [Sphingobacterium sp. UT-1RO-CII-1]|uniref:YchJ family protein n=1 Tax=Sphingobacterium sp. UT-1RO-CII-1 TaxID=2995225 RepID=UPI00227A65C5|nr:YchJ family metal-binding protein [Sphingobacterium sp. UT-1RO-CII-1]MCY4781367.1 YchJ family metal-binding protein [Sphingobacterium sp. UT-1RO-CII-1]
MTNNLPKECPCGSGKKYTNCCGIVHNDIKNAISPEQLMRARYTAFCLHNIDFLYNTYHPSIRSYQSKNAIRDWALENKWVKLEIIDNSKSDVEFKAYYLDTNHSLNIHHEKSFFKQSRESWYYLKGIVK